MIGIEITVTNLSNERFIYIDVKNQIVKFNNKEKKIEENFIDELIRIIRCWDNEYYGNNIIDSEKFLIKIITDNSTDIIKGNGKYPENYYVFKKLIGELYE